MIKNLHRRNQEQARRLQEEGEKVRPAPASTRRASTSALPSAVAKDRGASTFLTGLESMNSPLSLDEMYELYQLEGRIRGRSRPSGQVCGDVPVSDHPDAPQAADVASSLAATPPQAYTRFENSDDGAKAVPPGDEHTDAPSPESANGPFTTEELTQLSQLEHLIQTRLPPPTSAASSSSLPLSHQYHPSTVHEFSA